jgi:peptidoglycan/LPS O-acetylase OafA/YrhL
MATASTATPSETGKIAELDGVRAISIVFVLLVHISYGRVSGGFLGVDIFFVLSGYLITLLLLRENEAHGSINLQNFYARRALRILPPLVLACALGALLPLCQRC